VFTDDGKLITRFGEYGEGKDATAGMYSEPHGIAVNQKGEIYIADRYNFSVHMLDAKHNPVFKWQTTATKTDNRFFPLGIAVSQSGNVYVSDNYAHCILKYSISK
jgi:DNA-binding beta-propeller fold protein YncE